MIASKLRVGMLVELAYDGERERIERRETIRDTDTGRVLSYRIWVHPNEYYFVGPDEDVAVYTSGGQEL